MKNNSSSGSQSVTITLKVHSEDIKSFRDPNQLGRKRYVLQVPVDEIAKAAIEFGPNPRNQDMGTSVVKAIQETLEDAPGWFQYANKGILINAQNAEYDNKAGELSLSLDKDLQNPWGDSLGGNMDGGHTQAVIIQQIRDNLWKNYESPKDKQWVNVEVLTGIDFDHLSFIAGARNRSVAVKDLALTVLNDELDWLIKGEFEKAGFRSEIAWRQNADGDVTGEDILVYLSLLNPAITDKTRCYVGAGSIIKGLRTSEQMAGLKDALIGKAVRWMKFVDYIHNSMEDWWIKHKDGLGENASFGNLEGVTKVNQPHKLVFLKKEQDYRVAKSWLMPIAFGFTAAFKLEEDDKILHSIADKVGPKLMENIYDITINEKRNMNAVGKNKSAWTSSEALVQAEYFAQKFAALTQQKNK
jgi:hypothetical protein